MKKRIYVILIFVILFIMLGTSTSLGASVHFTGSSSLFNDWLKLYVEDIEWNAGRQYTDDILAQLKEDYGYDGKYTKPIRISTTVTITEKRLLGYKTRLGNRNLIAGYVKGGPVLSKKKLETILGYEEQFGELKVGTSWRVVIDATMPDSLEDAPRDPNIGGDNDIYYQYAITATDLYSGAEIEDKWGTNPYSDEANGDYEGPIAEAVDDVENGLDKIGQIKDFLDNAKENAITALANWIISLGDGLQELANFAQTWTLGRIELMHAPTEIESATGGTTNDGKGTVKTEAVNTIIPQYDNPFDDPLNINSYLNYKKITKDESNLAKRVGNTKSTRFIEENDIDGEKHNFTENTPIPVIGTDIYTLAAGKVDSIKTNFFERPEDEEERGIFNGIVNFVASLIHGLMYIAAGLILTATIWHGVGLSKASVSGNINEQNKHKLALRKLVIALILLFSILFLEAMCLYLSEGILNNVKSETSGNKYEGPIRVTVENLYSFSTTPTGYVRYMAGLDNIYLCSKKIAYGAIYLLMAFANCVLAIGMFVRSFILMFASIMGFGLVLVYIFKSQDASLVPFKQWFITYFAISLIQVLLAMVARIMLEVIV